MLHRRYLVPRIRRILGCREKFDLEEWTVDTDRGVITFLARRLRDHVEEVSASYLKLTDVEGNRYGLPDIDALDPVSQRLLEEKL